MKENWSRADPVLALDPAAVTGLIRPAFPKADVASFQVLPGGLANTNLEVVLCGQAAPVVLRIYQRDPGQARKEWAISERLAGHVPLARFIHFSEDTEVTGGPYAILEWVEGDRLESVGSSFGRSEWQSAGFSIGRTLGAIHEVTFDRHGFLDAALDIDQAVDLGPDGLRRYLVRCLIEGPGGERLGGELTSRLLAFVDREGYRLDAWIDRPCLVHSDFNDRNILVRKVEEDDWEVAAVLDWEFAYSGSPAADFGNLLRSAAGLNETFVAAASEGYRSAGRELPRDWLRTARIADLFAWAELLSRPNGDAARISDARQVIEATLAKAHWK